MPFTPSHRLEFTSALTAGAGGARALGDDVLVPREARGPDLLKFAGTDFMSRWLDRRDPGDPFDDVHDVVRRTVGRGTSVETDAPPWDYVTLWRKLCLPTHLKFYLVVSEVQCVKNGRLARLGPLSLPRPGFVVRRRRTMVPSPDRRITRAQADAALASPMQYWDTLCRAWLDLPHGGAPLDDSGRPRERVFTMSRHPAFTERAILWGLLPVADTELDTCVVAERERILAENNARHRDAMRSLMQGSPPLSIEQIGRASRGDQSDPVAATRFNEALSGRMLPVPPLPTRVGANHLYFIHCVALHRDDAACPDAALRRQWSCAGETFQIALPLDPECAPTADIQVPDIENSLKRLCNIDPSGRADLQLQDIFKLAPLRGTTVSLPEDSILDMSAIGGLGDIPGGDPSGIRFGMICSFSFVITFIVAFVLFWAMFLILSFFFWWFWALFLCFPIF